MRRRRPLRHLFGRSLAAGLLALCCGPARPLDLLDIAEAGVKGLLNPDCSRYCITGVCLWLQCDFLLCKVLPTFRVRHRWPDLLVSSWDQRGHPLREIQPLVDGWKRLREWSSGGGGDGSARRAASAHFLEADVLGSPLAAVDLPGFCEPSPQPFRPYYASLQDVDLWRGRGGLIQAYLGEENNDGDREFTAQGRSWGRLFPRTGFVDAPLDPQGAAALAAHRALDIALAGKGRLHTKLPGDARQEDDRSDAHDGACWQRLGEDGGGEGGGEEGECATMLPPSRPPALPGGGHAWLYWSNYACCLKGPGTKIWELDIPDICIGHQQ